MKNGIAGRKLVGAVSKYSSLTQRAHFSYSEFSLSLLRLKRLSPVSGSGGLHDR
jgi:hypothetical protein